MSANKRMISVPDVTAEARRLQMLLGRTRVPVDLPKLDEDETQEKILDELARAKNIDKFTVCTQKLLALLLQE